MGLLSNVMGAAAGVVKGVTQAAPAAVATVVDHATQGASVGVAALPLPAAVKGPLTAVVGDPHPAGTGSDEMASLTRKAFIVVTGLSIASKVPGWAKALILGPGLTGAIAIEHAATKWLLSPTPAAPAAADAFSSPPA
jgi:hypothetical protein